MNLRNKLNIFYTVFVIEKKTNKTLEVKEYIKH